MNRNLIKINISNIEDFLWAFFYCFNKAILHIVVFCLRVRPIHTSSFLPSFPNHIDFD